MASNDVPYASQRIFVIVPNKNGMSHLAYSIPSLLASDADGLSVVVVDDRSSDDSRELLARYPSVKVLSNNGKRGFAATVNVGIRYALSHDCSIVVVSNSDIKIPSWLLRNTVKAFQSDKTVGVIGYKEIIRTRSGGEFNPEESPLVCVDSSEIPGCFFAVRASVFAQVGLFDEDYFMYGEDNDFFFRVKRAGVRTITCNFPVWHYSEGASEHRLLPVWLAYRNALRFSIKNFDAAGNIRMLGALVYYGCSPKNPGPSGDPSMLRLRRYNIVFNGVLILASILWNIANLMSTLRARRLESSMNTSSGKMERVG